jgi:cob(I)alamin adenosyltransferase
MKVYTRTGDAGETSLFSGGRVPKDHHRIEAYGTVDELVSLLGLLRCEPLPDVVEEKLVAAQNSLFAVGAALADPDGRLEHDAHAWNVEAIEGWIDAMDEELDPLTAFIIPGGSRAAALAHVARTVCRRAERRVNVLIRDTGSVPGGLLPYLNRLSDALFVLARLINARGGIPETEWRPQGQR